MNKQPNTLFTPKAMRLFTATRGTVISMAFTRLLAILAAYTKPERLALPGKSGEHQLMNQAVFYGKREQSDARVSA